MIIFIPIYKTIYIYLFQYIKSFLIILIPVYKTIMIVLNNYNYYVILHILHDSLYGFKLDVNYMKAAKS